MPEYLPFYSKTQKRRHKVRPGITGWAQINGRDEIALNEKVAFEKEYLERKSFWFDLKILVLTFTSVLRSDGVKH